MGKIRTAVIGDETAEEKAKKAAEVKREQKKLAKGKESDKSVTNPVKSDLQKAQDILKMMEEEEKTTEIKPIKTIKSVKPIKDVEETERKETDKPKTDKPVSDNRKQKADKPKFTRGKKYLEAKKLVDKTKTYSLGEALDLAKKSSYSTFEGTIEAHFNVVAKGMRGTVQLPHGTGKTIKVAVASDSLLEEIAAGKMDFDILIAHPSMMPKLAKVAKVLGPKGLMPNPKTGTIGENVEELALRLRSGQQSWKTEPDFPIVHTVLGKASFDNKKLEENYLAIAKSLGKDKIKSVFLKATMGPSVKVHVS